MSNDKLIPAEGEIRYLPKTPVVYLSIMRTADGTPRGTPIWSSFDNNSERRSMDNESMASTFLSLSKSISDVADDKEKDGKIIRLNVNEKTYNIYLPNPNDDMQICYVVVFEQTDDILVKNEYKTELVRIITETLRSNSNFRDFLDDDINIRLNKGDQIYDEIYNKIVDNIKKWDRKRVKYLKKKRDEQRILEEEKRLMDKDTNESAESVDTGDDVEYT